MAELHKWMHATHLCYAVARQVCFPMAGGVCACMHTACAFIQTPMLLQDDFGTPQVMDAVFSKALASY